MYFESALAALIVGALLGGSFKKLLELRVRFIWALAASLIVSLLPRIPAVGAVLVTLGEPAAVSAAVLRYGFLLIFAAANIRCIPVCVIGAGGLLNAAAMLANSGRMPVAASALASGGKSAAALEAGKIFNYVSASASTRLYPLCDIIRARGFGVYYLSAGDIVISAGVFLLIIALMQPKRLRRRGAQGGGHDD